MDENKSGSPSKGSDDFNFDEFFNSFESFESFENFEASSKQKKAEPAAPAKPETTEPVIPAESLDFLNDARKDIDSIISDFEKEIPKEEAVTDIPVSAAPADNFTINMPKTDIKAQPLPIDNYHAPANRKPSVTYVPDDAININDIPGYEIKTKKKSVKAEESKGKKKKKSSSSEIIRKLVLALSIIVIIGSGGYLLKTYIIDPYMADVKNTKAADELIDVEAIPDGTMESEVWDELHKKYPDVKFADDMLIKYANLYAANTDLRGWISIPAFKIDMPIAQGADNSYYLKKDIYKKWTDYGVPFFDYRNKTYFLDRNTIVYGHNMKYSDKIFGMIEDYKTVNGFKQAPTIQCNTIYQDYTWKVYAVFLTNSESKDDNGYIFNYTFTRLNDKKFMEYIAEVDKRALYKTGVDMLPSDSILTISTCCYDFDSAKLVVLARLVRDGESSDVDTSKAVANANPKYPQAWYDANDKSNPYANDERWYA